MKISRNSERLRIILAMTLIFWAGSAMAQEQRCNELGAVCKCSEPLDVGSFTTTETKFINPSDSNSKQCHGGTQAFEVNPGSTGDVVPTPATGLPAGNTVDYVFRNNRHYGIAMLGWANGNIQPSTKRLCYRHYVRMSPGYDGGTAHRCNPGKFNQMKWNQNYDVGMGGGGGYSVTSGTYWWHNWPSGGMGATNVPNTGNLSYADCYGEWCKIESCISGDFAGGTGNFYTEAYMVRLRDGKRRDWPRWNMGRGNPGLNMGVGWIVNSYREAGPGTCDVGNPQDFSAWREYSHLMQAEWTTDVPGTFIGPAVEIEPAGSTPPPPPSVPSAELGKPGTPAYQAPQ